MAPAEAIPPANTTTTTPFTGAAASGAFTTTPTAIDPYTYQVGFGNHFASEALTGALPIGYNTPQRYAYNLISEQLNVFTPTNGNVEFTLQDLGLKTITGHGNSMAKEGLAVYIYLANKLIEKRAFCNNNGDILILPQEGRLDIQTEFGKLMVLPGELVVIQAGIKFSVRMPDGAGRGYIQEVFRAHYELPKLGPVGSNGMAQPRDFKTPVASFKVDQSEWTVVVKLVGKLFTYNQGHTPFNVVAWHGNYTPYNDPSIYCQVACNTFRPPYYHRNVCTEIMGMVCGKWALSGSLEPGGLTYEPSYMPHGEGQELWKQATSVELVPQRVGEGSMAFMMHISAHVSLTKYALKRCANLQKMQVVGRIEPPLYSWEKISCAVGRHDYYNVKPQNGE
ncbi:homogentisate 1,2-dioxygenase [Lasiosphaeria hispida]|uniref:homogentisate 1,2-dioxygenase n=1 Tax=Lasiosphaeria hispida TaxID=260671 RepID=A0AAJ0H7A3_9PEZI|nr:homogentisate 1,2-dioxygenase [Lasiosphaeria hispida]